VQEGRLAVLEATDETVLSPGDVVEVKLKRRDPTSMELPSIEAARNLGLNPASLADGSISTSR
jgi:hypothetical protein